MSAVLKPCSRWGSLFRFAIGVWLLPATCFAQVDSDTATVPDSKEIQQTLSEQVRK